MQRYKISLIILLNLALFPAFAATPDPKYCIMLQQLTPGMNIGDVFLLMGPPHTFGQPPNLDINTVKNAPQPSMQPQNAPNPAGNTPEARARILKSMAADPILGAFINAPPDAKNVLIWNFENNTLSVSVKVKGPTVTDVKANFSCN